MSASPSKADISQCLIWGEFKSLKIWLSDYQNFHQGFGFGNGIGSERVVGADKV